MKGVTAVKFFSEIKNLFQGIDINVTERLDTAEASFAITYNLLPTIETFEKIINRSGIIYFFSLSPPSVFLVQPVRLYLQE